MLSAPRVSSLYGRFTVTNPIHPLFGQVIEGKVFNTRGGNHIEYRSSTGDVYRIPYSSLDIEIPLYEPNKDMLGYFSINHLRLLEKLIKDLCCKKCLTTNFKDSSNDDQGPHQ